jgi:hypothetical protein
VDRNAADEDFDGVVKFLAFLCWDAKAQALGNSLRNSKLVEQICCAPRRLIAHTPGLESHSLALRWAPGVFMAASQVLPIAMKKSLRKSTLNDGVTC